MSYTVSHIPGVRVPEDVGGAADPAVVGEDLLVGAAVVAVNVVARELEKNRNSDSLTVFGLFQELIPELLAK